ncbi:MAG: class I SAM-dependent methyltransferase [Candidatus Methanomethylicia archaeon]
MEKYDSTYMGYDKLYGEEQMEKYIEVIHEMGDIKWKIILDAGCGTGLLEKMLKEARQILGLDISIKMLKRAKRRNKDKVKYSWIYADAENIPIKTKSIDLVLMITVIQNLPNQLNALMEIKRILRNNGETIITYPKAHYTKEQIIEQISKTNLIITEMRFTNTKDIVVKLKKE